MITHSLSRTLIASAAILVALPAFGHDAADGRGQELFRPGLGHAATQDSALAFPTPPLYDGLGDAIGMTVTTDSTEAQAYFDQGLRLVWGFNHAEARRSFAHARTLDPSCAMCWWGEALALGPNINDAMNNADIGPAWEAILRATARADGVTAKEAALISALSARYGANAMAYRPGLDAAWVRAIGEVAAAWQDDVEIQVLYADVMMNLQPWDY